MVRANSLDEVLLMGDRTDGEIREYITKQHEESIKALAEKAEHDAIPVVTDLDVVNFPLLNAENKRVKAEEEKAVRALDRALSDKNNAQMP
jgi:hypothetical protein